MASFSSSKKNVSSLLDQRLELSEAVAKMSLNSSSNNNKPIQLYYEMRCQSKFIGRCLILNYEKFSEPELIRKGSSVDAQKLLETFTNLRFKAKIYDNLTVEETSDLFEKESKRNHSKYDCFTVCILSHGDRNGELYCYDDKIFAKQIFEYFSDTQCPTLTGKPKLFFIQACQGCELDSGVLVRFAQSLESDQMQQHNENYVDLNNFADFLVAYSTFHGFYAFRNCQNGSYFITALCIILSNFATGGDHRPPYHLMEMLTRVCHWVAFEYESKTADPNSDKNRKKQIPCIYSTLTRLVRFGPQTSS